MAPGPEEWFVRSNKPDQQAKRLIAAILIEPRQRAVDGQIVWINVEILLLGADLALPAFFEKRIGVVVGGIVVAKVVVPVALLGAIWKVHLAQNCNFVACLVKKVGKERYVGG